MVEYKEGLFETPYMRPDSVPDLGAI